MSNKLWYLWIIIMGFLVLLVSSGVRALPSILVLPWQQNFLWNRGEISAVIATGTFLFGLIGPFSAAFMQRYGARLVGTVVIFILAIVTLSLTFMTKIWQAELLVGIISGTMTGAVADVYGIYIANNWFYRNRGLVLGIFTASSSIGQLIILPLVAQILTDFGWRYTVTIVAVFVFLISLVVWLFMRDYPQQVGLPPLGYHQPIKPAYPKINVQAVLLQPLNILTVALKSQYFWLLALPFLVCGASTYGLIGVHFIAAGHDYAISEVQASNFLALMGICDIIGSLIAGVLTEKIDPRFILIVMYVLRGFTLFFLPFAFFYGGIWLIIYVILFGLSWNATVSPTIQLLSTHFGQKNSGMLFGWIFVIHQIGGALMAYLSGAIHDEMQSYVMAFIMAGALCMIAALIVIFIPAKQLNE
ncbi:MFS transporter [Liquorilactobacillus satsumensis]